MATETQTGLTGHLRGVTTTTLASLAGVAAAVVSGLVVGTVPAAASDQRALLILVGFIVVQYPLLKLVGIDVQGFGAKDHLYIAFMTFSLWFVTYTIILSSAVQF